MESSSGIDLETGKTAVEYRVMQGPVYGQALAGAGRLLFLAGERRSRASYGGFYAFDAATGRCRWRYERPDLHGVLVVVSEGRVYGIGSDGFVYAFGQ